MRIDWHYFNYLFIGFVDHKNETFVAVVRSLLVFSPAILHWMMRSMELNETMDANNFYHFRAGDSNEWNVNELLWNVDGRCRCVVDLNGIEYTFIVMRDWLLLLHWQIERRKNSYSSAKSFSRFLGTFFYCNSMGDHYSPSISHMCCVLLLSIDSYIISSRLPSHLPTLSQRIFCWPASAVMIPNYSRRTLMEKRKSFVW